MTGWRFSRTRSIPPGIAWSIRVALRANEANRKTNAGEIRPADRAGPAQAANRSMADVIAGILESTPEEV